MPTAKMTTNGQVTIPKMIRESLHLTPGCILDAQMNEAGKIVLTPQHSAEKALPSLEALRREYAEAAKDLDAEHEAKEWADALICDFDA